VDLEEIAAAHQAAMKAVTHRVIVCAGTGCIAGGSLAVADAFVATLKERGITASVELTPEEESPSVLVSHSGCQGFCQAGPLVTILPEAILYTRVRAADVEEIVTITLENGGVV
jgi:NADH-quinone oxidoreductase subunit F